MSILFSLRYLNLITIKLFALNGIFFYFFKEINIQNNYFLNERYLDPKKLFKDPIRAPNNQAIL